MKKLFLAIIFCLFAISAWAMSGPFMQSMVGSGGCDDCSGDLKFAWHMEDNDSTPDVTLGNPCGCSDGDTIGAETGSPVFSTTQKSDGTYSLHIDALDEFYTFAVSAKDLIDPDNVKITFDIYIVSYPSATLTHEIIRATDDPTNYLRIYLFEGNVKVRHEGQHTFDDVSVSVSTGSWVSCEYQAKTGVTGVDHYLICGVTSDENDDDLITLTATTDKLVYGDSYGTGAGEYYLDNVKVYPCDRY